MRDFRDAKAMAHALRGALQLKTIETTHSECLELIAKAFGYDNWNILAAKIQTASSSTPDTPALGPTPAQVPAQKPLFYCAFCGKSQLDVRTLVAGPDTFICDECVATCTDVIEDHDIWTLLQADEESGD